MSRRGLFAGTLGAAGLALYLWTASTAPVVLWSDSETDLAWARAGQGILTPAGTHDHPAKPGYLLFLRAALSIGGGSPRGVVVLQSLLLAAAIGAASLIVGRRLGFACGAAVFLVEILFLRTRDAASSVMSEPLAAALFLLVVAVLLAPPRRTAVLLACGLALGFLFLVRPNVGAIAALLAALRLGLDRRWRGLSALGFAAAAFVLPLWLASSPGPGQTPRDLAYTLREARADDLWLPSADAPVPPSALARGGPDAFRQRTWRLTHGLLGTEYYDARWSDAYRTASTLSRLAAPLLILGAIALFFVVPARGRPVGAMGLLLVALIAVQGLILGSLPRYVLPFLPGLLALGTCAAASLGAAERWRPIAAAALLAAAILFLRRQPSGLAWEWGRIEASGASIVQEIPRAALPERAPATLHVRIAPPSSPTSAGLEVRSADGALLHASRGDGRWDRPEIAIPLPQGLLDANRRGPVTMALLATGAYGANDYLLFPVIPFPWRAPALREPGGDLSPSTGIAAGALDWWAHPGEDER